MASPLSAVHAQTPSEESLFAKASVDNDRPYLGQQVTYLFKLHRRSDLPSLPSQVQYNPPDFAGFWNNQPAQPDQRDYTEAIDSNQYRIIELRTSLFPSVVGTIRIGPGTLTIPSSFSGEPMLLDSAPVAVVVRPLPPAAPAEFAGAVGRFHISGQVDTTTGKANKPVQLTVKVSGEGNIDALPDPAWPEFADWRVIKSPADAESQVIDGRLTGSRTYNIVLMPDKAGELTIPEIGYTYFDPENEQYVRATTVPIGMSIADADGLAPAPASNGEAAAEQRGSEVRPIKAVPSSLRQSGRELTDSIVYWLAWGIPVLSIAGAAAWRRRRIGLEAALTSPNQKNALRNAKTALARAASSGDDPRDAAAKAMLSYLSDRLREPLAGQTREALRQRLQNAGVPPDMARRVEDTLAASEAAKYTPAASSNDGTRGHAERATQLLTDLEGAISK